MHVFAQSKTFEAGTSEDFGDFGDLDLAALLNTEVESASAKKEPISDAPAVIEVITPEQMKVWGVTNLNDALAHIPNVEVVENYYGYADINIRGLKEPLYNTKILLLLDGVPLYEIGNMSAHLEQIPINSIARIEVIRGPGAVLFGTNAYAGVINIYTRKPEKSEVRAQARLGSQLTPSDRQASGGTGTFGSDLRLDASWVWGSGYARFSVQGYVTPRWTATVAQAEDGLPASYPRWETTVSSIAQVEQRFGEQKFDLLAGFASQQKMKWGVFPESEYDSEPNDLKTWFVDLAWRGKFGNLDTLARVSWSQYLREGNLGRFPDPLDMKTPFAQHVGWDKRQYLGIDTSTYRAKTSVAYASELLSLTGGASAALETFNDYTLKFNNDNVLSPIQPPINSNAKMLDTNLFTQGSLTPITPVTITLGVRYNIFAADPVVDNAPRPKVKHHPSARGAVVWRINDHHNLKLLYGQAFRLPAMFELYANAKAIVLGDPNLQPETVNTAELAWDGRPLPGLSLRADVFQSTTKNEIARITHVNGTSIYANIEGMVSWGVEFSGRWLPTPWLDLFAVAGFQEAWAAANATDPTVGVGQGFMGSHYTRYQSDIARVTTNGGASFKLLDNALILTPMVQYIGKRAGLGGVVLWNATVWYTLNDSWDIGLIGSNLFDKQYASPELIRGHTPHGMVNNQPRYIALTASARF